MKVIESYWKDAVAVCLMAPGVFFRCNSFSDFPSTNYAKILSDQTKERKKFFGFITSTYFIFVDLCI